MTRCIEIADRPVGPGHGCFVIAEAGVNHNGDLDMAMRLVEVAAAAGADAVKFQTFRAEELASAAAGKAEYQKAAVGEEGNQVAMLKRLELPFDAFIKLKRHCEALGILFLSTPFDDGSAEFLRDIGMAAFKVPSGELTNLPFLARIATYGRPMIVSTGMATLSEVEQAVATINGAGCRELALLHCVSAYPARAADANLRAMATLEAAFGLPVGYSDHTEGLPVPLAAVALGATIIEKHFTLDRSLPGPDHAASLEPAELTALVAGIRAVGEALGDGRKMPRAIEQGLAQVARKSLVAARDLPTGTVLALADVAVKRPGNGLAPSLLPHLLGRRLARSLARDDLFSLDQLS